MRSGSEEQSKFIEYVVGIMEFTLKTRRAFIRILEDVGVKYMVGDELHKEEYFSLVGDGKRILDAERKIKALKSNLIGLQQAYLLSVDAPKALTGLSNATTRLLSQLFDVADAFHSFFGNPLHEHYGFHYFKLGWKRMELFEAEYGVMREVLRDLLEPVTYRETFENIENISIL
jgi:hypothetical protein